ncbi:MAG: division/cell wall cluster transcriptional repressor MraZ [Thermodesulfobacteriota bacterium]|nr:MAG: division/cell wall cluster transcriptional repressor MraZ [Thermodesulfobacteriota bacterium]
MFDGRRSRILDPKGRLNIPALYKNILRGKYRDDRLIVTNLPYCLLAYPVDEWRIKVEKWRVIEEKLGPYLFPPPEMLSLMRYLLGGAVECRLDGQGRILISPELRAETGLKRDVVLQGMSTHFEIWDKDRLNKELQKTRDNFDQYSSDITAKFGISG